MSISKYDKKNQEDYYKIGDISRMYNLSTDSLRYYEERGIICPIRGENGYRLYSRNDIWRLNVIVNLRNLGFSVDRIHQYFKNRSIDTTKNLLNEELEIIENKQKELHELKKSVINELKVIDEASYLDIGKIFVQEIKPRRAFKINRDYSVDEDMDLLMKELAEKSGKNIQLIGNNRIASIIADENSKSTYNAAVLFDDEGDTVIPGGKYLSICYRGKWNSCYNAALLKEYAAANHIKLEGTFMDIIWIDIHTAEPMEEHISEVQGLIAEA